VWIGDLNVEGKMAWYRTILTALGIVFLLAQTCGCTGSSSPTPVPPPSPAHTPTALPPAPTPTATPTPIALVRGLLEDLVLQAEDLPPALEYIGGQHDGPNDYTVVYFDAAGLTVENPLRMGVLGVVANLAIYPDVAGAERAYASLGMLDEEAIAQGIADTAGEVSVYSVRAHADQIEGADRLEAVRVHYAIGGVGVVAYHYRIRVTNAVSGVIVTSRVAASGDDPPGQRERVHEIAARQVARLVEARQRALESDA
jgi:hypothetical protein